MDCNKLRVLLISTIYETLDEETAKEVNAHLATCATCRRQVEEARALLKGYREVPKPTPPQGAIAAALEAGRKTRKEIEEKNKTRRIVRDSSLRRIIQSPALATAALFLIIITIFFYNSNADKKPVNQVMKAIDRDHSALTEGKVLMPSPEAVTPQPIAEEPARLKTVEAMKPRIVAVKDESVEEESGIVLAEAKEVPPPSGENTDTVYLGISRAAHQAMVIQTETIPEETLAEAESPRLMTSKEFLWKEAVDEADMPTAGLEIPPATADVNEEDTATDTMALALNKSSLETERAEDFREIEAPAIQSEATSSPTFARARRSAAKMGSAVALEKRPETEAAPAPVLTARIWTEEEKISQEMPIIIHYEIRNNGDEAVILWITGFWPNHRIEVLDQDGEPVEMTEAGKKRLEAFNPQGEKNQDASLSLAPGEADTDLTSYDLREFFKMDNPGSYTVRYLFEEKAPGGWQGQLWSNPLTIQVTE